MGGIGGSGRGKMETTVLEQQLKNIKNKIKRLSSIVLVPSEAIPLLFKPLLPIS